MQIQQALLTTNPYSRPGTKIGKITNIVIHWVGNASSTAIANRNYFESLKDKKTYASSHYIVGLQGEIIQCVPENEVAYHANQANSYSIGIENCHPDWNGEFNQMTYNSLIELCVDICKRYNLDPEVALIRHYDVTKKQCPLYYVQHLDAWKKLKLDVKVAMNPSKEDTELYEACRKIILSGINLNINQWKRLDLIKLNNVQALLTKLGGLDKLVSLQVIGQKELWLTGKYNANHVRSLLIKYSKTLG
ncbi:MAG: N-acetylmuramoyl-L-alanine amidase [Cellulosilyticum sp.]|nr:N-acetylmuramoyl-L-alanine amidase [Cellulosilyticum sp.]